LNSIQEDGGSLPDNAGPCFFSSTTIQETSTYEDFVSVAFSEPGVEAVMRRLARVIALVCLSSTLDCSDSFEEPSAM
jgi:hypothetical protein